jgi:hypothetical protein
MTNSRIDLMGAIAINRFLESNRAGERALALVAPTSPDIVDEAC